MNRFSPELLFKIRNDIPLESLIRDTLRLPHKKSEGYFRFLCPICLDFHTAVNSKINMGRCFNCKKNFNPIDLMIVVWEIPFKEAVKKLKTFLPLN